MSPLLSKRLRLRLEFNGLGFCGWQLQSDLHEAEKPSIQGSLEKALKVYLKSSERVVVQGCGRTDAGVSAREFFMHFDLPTSTPLTLDLEKLRHSLNGILPEGISVIHCESMHADFHALRDVKWKIYQYTLFIRRAKPTLEAQNAYWVSHPYENFNLDALSRALEDFKGEHDISSFAASDHGLEDTIRKIFWTSYELSYLDPAGQDAHQGVLLRLNFCGEGFLKHQVRTMVGTLIEIALGKREPQSIQNLLKNPQPRAHAGFCAPAHALMLKEVSYQEYKEAT